MERVYGSKRARTAIFAESADQLALEAAAAAEDAHANGMPNGSATVSLTVQAVPALPRNSIC